ncbi:hypothetical protein [Stakelama sediminis]|uniref:hypothetical protein n=1 Tax=Stakelama sediminis TaxID=463200 RepID=UPI001C84D2AF|nr:hypothetical protein [Stakelama sediminis]
MSATALVAYPVKAAALATTPAALKAIYQFGGCVADHSREKASAALKLDFRTGAYSRALHVLAKNNVDCSRDAKWFKVRSSSLFFAGALAEKLLSEGPDSLDSRLTHAAEGPPTQPRSNFDAMAICIVRSSPDGVSTLFRSAVASAEEKHALAALQPTINACHKFAPRIDASDAAMRAVLATAAYRVVNGEAPNGKAA